MTGKEAVKVLYEERAYAFDESNIHYDNIGRSLSIIEKDLEILEILKRNLYVETGTGRFKGIQVIQCSLGNQHSEDFNKVKEWLEYDKDNL